MIRIIINISKGNFILIFQNLSEKLLKKELEFTQLEEKHNEECVSKKNIQASLHQKDLDCQQLQSRLSASETSLQRIQAELGEKGETTQKLKEELSEVETKYQHLKAEFKQLQQQREEKDQHGLQLQSEVNQVRDVNFIYYNSSCGFLVCLIVT